MLRWTQLLRAEPHSNACQQRAARNLGPSSPMTVAWGEGAGIPLEPALGLACTRQQRHWALSPHRWTGTPQSTSTWSRMLLAGGTTGIKLQHRSQVQRINAVYTSTFATAKALARAGPLSAMTTFSVLWKIASALLGGGCACDCNWEPGPREQHSSTAARSFHNSRLKAVRLEVSACSAQREPRLAHAY